MNRLEKWLLRRIVRQQVQQGSSHLRNIAELFGVVRDECAREFYEDNAATLNEMLHDCLEASSRAAAR